MEYFDAFDDGEKTITDAEKRFQKLRQAIADDDEARKKLIETQEKSAESLQKQLEILNATSEAEKMRIQLGHEASQSELILIDLIVKKEESLKREKEAIKKSEKAAKDRIKTMKAEAKAFQAMLDTITMAEFDLADAELALGAATGKVTKEQAKDVGLLLGFQKKLINQFGDRVKISGDMKDIQNTLNVTLDEATDLESDLLGILGEIFMAQLRVNNVDSESVKILKEKIELLKGQNEAYGKYGEVIGGLGAAFGALTSSLGGIDFSAMDELKAALSLDLDDPEKGLENQATLLQAQLDMRESFYGQMGEMAANFIQQEAARNEQAIRSEASRELEALRQTRKFKRMSDSQKAAAEKKITDATNAKLKKQHKIQQGAAIASVWIDAIKASFHAVEGAWVTVGQPWVGIIMGLAALQTAMISSQKAPTFAKGGDFIVPPGYPKDSFPIRVESGERVQITPKSDVGGMFPSSSTVNINFSGNVLSQDFIENEAIPQIKEAIRRGADIGVA